MQIKTVNFVSESELFKGLDKLADVFFENDTDCSFGDDGNVYTIVDPEWIVKKLNDFGVQEDDADAEVAVQMSTLRQRVKDLPENTYVDLER
jgi:hypothetical protein